MVRAKNTVILVLSLVFALFILGFASACHCGDGSINQITEQCDDGNLINTDACSNLCKINNPQPPQPTCDHDIALRFSYSNSFGTGIAVGYENGTWISGNTVNLSEGNYNIKYFIDNKKEADDNVSITVKLDGNNLIPNYNYVINSYHSKEITLNTSQLCGLHTISVNITSDGDECNKTDNYASRQIYVSCTVIPPVPTQTCGNNITEGTEQCDDGNKINEDGCSSLCITEQSQEDEDDTDNVKHHYTTVNFKDLCESNWECLGWSECDNNGFMTRTCSDTNLCSVVYNKPAETVGCGLQKSLAKKENNNSLLWMIFLTGLLLIIVISLGKFSKK